MKIVCISDIHGLHKEMHHAMPEEGDVLVVAGDISNVGERYQVESFGAWLKKLPYEKKIVVAGNHDWCFANSKKKKAPEWLKTDESIVYLEDSSYTYKGVKFYGSPWQPEFYNWAFNLKPGEELQDIWAQVPDDTDVLITHSAPKGIMDPSMTGDSVGDLDLLDRVLEVRPKLHVFGHFHSGHGVEEKGSTTYVNASICNDNYIPCNQPIEVTI